MREKSLGKLVIAALVVVGIVVFIKSANREAAKDDEVEKSMLAGRPPSGPSYAGTALVHWEHDSGDEYNVHLSDPENSFCGSVHYSVAHESYEHSVYEVKDPVCQAAKADPADPAGGTLKEMPECWHNFVNLDSARSYLWARCEVVALADRANRAKLAPGETY